MDQDIDLDRQLYDRLAGSLDPRSGEVMPFVPAAELVSAALLRICFPRRIELVVHGWPHFGWYYVTREDQAVSASFHYRKIDDRVLRIMQNLIDEIETGKYDTKKTVNEKARAIMSDRGLTSYMNKTKWNELFEGLAGISGVQIKYRTLFDDSDPEEYWPAAADEQLMHMNTAQIEWFMISDSVVMTDRVGRLIEPAVTRSDIRGKIKDVLKEYSIPYEYLAGEGAFVVYGYR